MNPLLRNGAQGRYDTLQYWKSTGIAGKGGVIQGKEFKIWVDWLRKMVSSKMAK